MTCGVLCVEGKLCESPRPLTTQCHTEEFQFEHIYIKRTSVLTFPRDFMILKNKWFVTSFELPAILCHFYSAFIKCVHPGSFQAPYLDDISAIFSAKASRR